MDGECIVYKWVAVAHTVRGLRKDWSIISPQIYTTSFEH